MLGGPWGRWGGEQQCGDDLGKRGVSGAERAPEVKGSEEGRGETSVAASRTLAWRVAACSPEEDVGWKGWLFLGEEIWACGKAGGKELVRGKLKTGKKDAWEVGRSDPGFRSFLMFYKKFKIFFNADILKVFVEFVTILLLFWFLGWPPCRILAPWAGITCFGRWSLPLDHWTTRESQVLFEKTYSLSVYSMESCVCV